MYSIGNPYIIGYPYSIGAVHDRRGETGSTASRGVTVQPVRRVVEARRAGTAPANFSDMGGPGMVWAGDRWVRGTAPAAPAPGEMTILPYPQAVMPGIPAMDPSVMALLEQERQTEMMLANMERAAAARARIEQMQERAQALQYGEDSGYAAPDFAKPATAGANPYGGHGSDGWTNQIPFAATAVGAGATVPLTFQCNRAARICVLTTLVGGANFSLTDAKINGVSVRENLGANPLPLTYFEDTNSKRAFILPWAAKNDRIELFVRNTSANPADVSILADDIETNHDPSRLPPGLFGTLLTTLVGAR